MMTTDIYRNARTHIHFCTCRGAGDVLDNRMCGGNFTDFSHAFRIALQPYHFLHHSVVYVCVCMYAIVSKWMCLSVFEDIQNNEGKNKEAEHFSKWAGWIKCLSLSQTVTDSPCLLCVYMYTVSALAINVCCQKKDDEMVYTSGFCYNEANKSLSWFAVSRSRPRSDVFDSQN